MNFYKRHIGDYLRDAGHLSLLEHGVYTRLLDVYYTREGPIPAEQAARLVGARTREEREAVDRVLAEFFEQVGNEWVQRRCEREIEAATTKAERNREVGKLGGRPRKTETQTVSEQKPTENPNGFQTEPKQNPSQTPDTRHQTPSRGENPPNPPPAAAATPLPDWLGADLWASWKRHRRAIRKPMTADAERLAIRALEQLRTEGYTPQQVIENAILQGWQGLYAPKASGAAPRPEARESTEEHNRRAFDEWLSADDGRTIDA